jgi:23S rRNA pseudouridine1911/1915/1917 synthase
MNEKLQTQPEEVEQELYEHHRFVVDPGQGALRIDKFLMTRVQNASRNKIQQAANAGNVLVNKQSVKPNYKVKPGDVISVVMTTPAREIELIPEDIPLNIVYEDDDLVVVNKSAGMVVHPAYGHYSGTLINALLGHFEKTGFSQKEGTGPYMVHRIDKDTSGLIIVAKNEIAQMKLGAQFFDHSIARKYYALVWGDVKDETGTIEGHIGRSHKDRKVMAIFPDGDYGKHATTHFKVVEKFAYVTLVECELETGRTHQIRAHMKYIHHPLFNDSTYGGDKILKGTTFTKYKQFVTNCFKTCPRQALHARSLGFIHPATGKELHFESDFPEDMQMLIEKWRNYSTHKSFEEIG